MRVGSKLFPNGTYLDVPPHVEIVFQPCGLGSHSRRFTFAPKLCSTFYELLLHCISYCKDLDRDRASLACAVCTLGVGRVSWSLEQSPGVEITYLDSLTFDVICQRGFAEDDSRRGK